MRVEKLNNRNANPKSTRPTKANAVRLNRLLTLSFAALALLLCCGTNSSAQQSAPVYVQFHTNIGDIDVQLLPDKAPLTVANFLRYVDRAAYDGSFIHRSVPGFVIQGGGYKFVNPDTVTVPQDPPVNNEFGLSNIRGTLAMAKVAGNPNSATNQWFFNISDNNAANLDAQNGGFTVFGRIVGVSGLTVLDRINALMSFDFGQPFESLPLINYSSGPVQDSNLVKVYAVTRLALNTTSGTGVTTQAGNSSVTFSNVSQTSTTTFTPVDAASAGTPPSGYTLCPTCAAYDITTTAAYTPPVNVCLAVPANLAAQSFLTLALLHGENGVLVDRTTNRVTNPDGTRQVCGSVSSLSPFALAQGPDATPTPTPTPTATPTPTPSPSPCSASVTYTVNDVKVTLGGDSFEFLGAQNASLMLTSGVAADGIFEGGMYLKPNQTTTPSGEYSANVSYTITFDNSVSTTLSKVLKYTVTPSLRTVSFETGDTKTVDLGAKGKIDVTLAAPWVLTSIANSGTVLLLVPARGDAATFRLHDIPACATPNTVQFSAATYDADEGAAPLSSGGVGSGVASEEVAAQAASTGMTVVQVTRMGDLSQPAEVEYATQSGTALDRTDFTAAYGTLRFAAGENSKSLVILITDDVYQEGPESFSVTLSNPVGVALGTPATATVQINSDDAATGASPVADPSFDSDHFVRYHYADFLNRLPDAAGLTFWKGQFDECGQRPVAERPGCREVKRVNVSAAFFLSIEFQETGYLVYRLHQAAFGTGEHLQLSRFLHDAQEIRQGIIVGQTNWEQQLAANKQLFAEQFVRRAEFLAQYPLTMDAQPFVDALNANTGGSLTQAERDAVVSQLAAAGNTTQARAQALRSIADDADFREREMNRAFVLMQYFGYLRRNPPDAPDLTLDFQGYNYWLNKLNQFGGNFVNAEMVRAFLSSFEYQKRFGQ